MGCGEHKGSLAQDCCNMCEVFKLTLTQFFCLNVPLPTMHATNRNGSLMQWLREATVWILESCKTSKLLARVCSAKLLQITLSSSFTSCLPATATRGHKNSCYCILKFAMKNTLNELSTNFPKHR